MTEMTDLALLHRILAGDEHAMSTIFDRHSTVIYSVALRVLNEQLKAENVLHEVLLMVWRSPETLLASGLSPKLWLTLEARDLAVKIVRKSAKETVSDKDKCLSSIRARQLLELAFFDGKMLRQICELMSVSQDAAKKSLFRALLDIRYEQGTTRPSNLESGWPIEILAVQSKNSDGNPRATPKPV